MSLIALYDEIISIKVIIVNVFNMLPYQKKIILQIAMEMIVVEGKF